MNVPDRGEQRVIRVFVSSTFRDMPVSRGNIKPPRRQCEATIRMIPSFDPDARDSRGYGAMPINPWLANEQTKMGCGRACPSDRLRANPGVGLEFPISAGF